MSEFDKRIAHLTEQQINELMEKYYGDGKAKDIVAEYGINIPVSKLYTVFPPLKCENEICEYCGYSMYQEQLIRANTRSIPERIFHEIEKWYLSRFYLCS